MQGKMWQKMKYRVYSIYMNEVAREKSKEPSVLPDKILWSTEKEKLKYRVDTMRYFREILKNASKKYPYFSTVTVTPELDDPMSLRVTTANSTSMKITLNNNPSMPSVIHSIRNDGLIHEYWLMIPDYLSEIILIIQLFIRMDRSIYQTALWSPIPYYSTIDNTFRIPDWTILIDFSQEWISPTKIENIVNGFSYILKKNPTNSPEWQKGI